VSLYDVLLMAGFTHREARSIVTDMPHVRRVEVEAKVNAQRFEVTIGSAVFEGVTVMRWHRPVDRPNDRSHDSVACSSTRSAPSSPSASTPSR